MELNYFVFVIINDELIKLRVSPWPVRVLYLFLQILLYLNTRLYCERGYEFTLSVKFWNKDALSWGHLEVFDSRGINIDQQKMYTLDFWFVENIPIS